MDSRTTPALKLWENVNAAVGAAKNDAELVRIFAVQGRYDLVRRHAERAIEHLIDVCDLAAPFAGE